MKFKVFIKTPNVEIARAVAHMAIKMIPHNKGFGWAYGNNPNDVSTGHFCQNMGINLEDDSLDVTHSDGNYFKVQGWHEVSFGEFVEAVAMQRWDKFVPNKSVNISEGRLASVSASGEVSLLSPNKETVKLTAEDVKLLASTVASF